MAIDLVAILASEFQKHWTHWVLALGTNSKQVRIIHFICSRIALFFGIVLETDKAVGKSIKEKINEALNKRLAEVESKREKILQREKKIAKLPDGPERRKLIFQKQQEEKSQRRNSSAPINEEQNLHESYQILLKVSYFNLSVLWSLFRACSQEVNYREKKREKERKKKEKLAKAASEIAAQKELEATDSEEEDLEKNVLIGAAVFWNVTESSLKYGYWIKMLTTQNQID